MEQTIIEIATNREQNIDAVRRRWERAGFTEQFGKFSRFAIPTPEQFAVLFPEQKTGQKQEQKAAKVAEQIPAFSVYEQPKPKPIPPLQSRVEAPKAKHEPAPTEAEIKQAKKYSRLSWAFDIIAVGIVAGHALLIWYDAAVLWGMAGLIGGGVSFFIVVLALIIALDDRKGITSEYALLLVFFVDAGAWFVHVPAFMQYGKTGATLTGWFCFAICTLSFAALFLFRHSKNA